MPHARKRTRALAIAVAMLLSFIFTINPVSAATKKVDSTSSLTGKTTNKGYQYTLAQDANQYLTLSLDSKYKDSTQRRVLKVYKMNKEKKLKLVVKTSLEKYSATRAKAYANKQLYYGIPVKKGTYYIVIDTYLGKTDKVMRTDAIAQFNFYADKPSN